MPVMRTQLLGIKCLDDAVNVLAALGYDKSANPWDLGMAPLPGVDRAVTVRAGRRRREGYAVVFAETSAAPRSFRPLARAVRDQVHDRPLIVLGVADTNGQWERMVLIRPRTAQTGAAVAVTKLDIDLRHPTQHDAEVLNAIEWSSTDDRVAHRQVDSAFDVEAVTNRFFRGLTEHYQHMVKEVEALMDDPAIADRLRRLGEEPAERAALRILTQILFVQFLQKKGFIEGDQDWLRHAYRDRKGPFYQSVLERLFYAGLGTPRDRRKTGDPDVPYLNGGLFERFYGNVSLPLPDELFDTADGLLGYLGRWTFTVYEDMPDEFEVAVDPEMLGKVFEHLAGEESVLEHGTVYTPRPVVHFMCREALLPWLCTRVDVSEAEARQLLTDEDPFVSESFRTSLGPDRLRRLLADLDEALDDLQVLDPAVGSGAFPLGMLSEIIRLRTLRHRALNQGTDPGPDQVTAWKNDAIRRCIYGVDIEPRAIELCRLRLWLSLLVDLPTGVEPEPLPNLDYRTVVADSLTDFANGIEVQNTRGDGGLPFFDEPELEELHRRWYRAFGDERDDLSRRIRDIENKVVNRQLSDALANARTEEQRSRIESLAERFTSQNREFPCFVPALHAPDIARRGGWDIVIMNPPYVGHKEVPQRLPASKVADIEAHYGTTHDLMVHFGYRALQLLREGGTVSMIFNDSIFSSGDAAELRRAWRDRANYFVLARTKCFETKAITGGVVVCSTDERLPETTRWVEGYKKEVADFTEASSDMPPVNTSVDAGELEVWVRPTSDYFVLPHRPFYRPSPAALTALDTFRETAGWREMWSFWKQKAGPDWQVFSNTPGLNKVIANLDKAGWTAARQPGDFVPFGIVVEGGQGLATGDDKSFLAAVEGTSAAASHLAMQERLEESLKDAPNAAADYRKLEPALGRERALIEVWDKHLKELKKPWPKGGAFRIAPADMVRRTPLTDDERADGIASGPCFVPFEKGDSSDSVDGRAIGAAWGRDNPIVIDWSTASVAKLEARKKAKQGRTPYFRNTHMWFQAGVSLNAVARYIRPRLVESGSIFGHGAPLYQPTAPWLSAESLCCLLFSDTVEFIVRTFLSSLMNIQVGDLRRVPLPVLTDEQDRHLTALCREAVSAKLGQGTRPLAEVEAEVHSTVRGLYGIAEDANLWVPR